MTEPARAVQNGPHRTFPCGYSTCNPTFDGWAWSPDATGAFWPHWNMAFSRARLGGIYFAADPGGDPDLVSAFFYGVLFDNSHSTSVIHVNNTHGLFLDLSLTPFGPDASFSTGFIKGMAGAITDLGILNAADHDVYWYLDSGASAAQNSFSYYLDRHTPKFYAGKDLNNNYVIGDYTNGGQPGLEITPAHVTIVGEAAQTLDLQGSAFQVNGAAAASCSAGTVNLTTLVITNGVVTHC